MRTNKRWKKAENKTNCKRDSKPDLKKRLRNICTWWVAFFLLSPIWLGNDKKSGRLRIPCPIKRERLTFFDCLNLQTKKFYWEKIEKVDSDIFIWFLTQLRQRFTGKDIVIILDNSSIHKSKKVCEYLNRFPHIHLFFSNVFTRVQSSRTYMGMDQGKSIWVVSGRWRIWISSAISKTNLAFQCGKLDQANTVEFGCLLSIVIIILCVYA